MPTYNSFSSIGSFNPQPTIIRPSAGDLEEARVKRLTDLAQLTNLQNQPAIESRRLALQKAGLDQNAFAQTQQSLLEQRGQDVTQRGQDIGANVSTRGQDLAAKSEEAARILTKRAQDLGQKSETARTHGSLLSTAFSRPDIPLSQLADAADSAGFPEFKKAFTAAHDHELTAKASQQIATLGVLKTAGKPADYLTALNAAKADPELFGALKKNAPPDILADIEATGAHVPPLAAPQSNVASAFSSDTPGYNPDLGKNIRDTVLKAPLGLANIGAGIFNTLLAPPANTIASVIGTPPLRKAKYATNYKDAFSR